MPRARLPSGTGGADSIFTGSMMVKSPDASLVTYTRYEPRGFDPPQPASIATTAAAPHAKLFDIALFLSCILEREVHAFFATDVQVYRVRHLAKLFMPCGHCVIARRHVHQFESAVRARDREIGVRHDADIGAHPRVHVALYRNHNLRTRKAVLHIGSASRLLLVP